MGTITDHEVLDDRVQTPTTMNPTPAIIFSVDSETNLVTTPPASTASKVVDTKAADAATNTPVLLTLDSVANNSVAN